MQVPWSAAAGAYRQCAREMGLGAGGERGCLFVSHMHPAHAFSTTNRIRDPVEGIAAHTVHALHSCRQQDLDKQISHTLCHVHAFLHRLTEWARPFPIARSPM